MWPRSWVPRFYWLHWAMSGQHFFELEEIGGNGTRITVSSL